jgi:hypothetical protein
MSKKLNKKYEEHESDSSDSIDILDAYIEASEMYLEALKLSDSQGADAAYIVGMTAVYFGKAFIAFTSTDNSSAIKGSLHEALNAYATAATFCETNGIGKQFVFTCHLVTESLRMESKNL